MPIVQRGTSNTLMRSLLLAGGLALLVGFAVAGGSLFERVDGTDATAGDAFPRAVLGALIGALIAAIGLAAMKLSHRWPGRSAAAAIVLLGALLGALIGASTAPDSSEQSEPDANNVSPLPDDEQQRRKDEYGQLDDNTRAGPIDADGDGKADVDSEGNPIIGYDADGDGVIDGYLVPCPPNSPTPVLPDELIAAAPPVLASIIAPSTIDEPEIPNGSIDWQCDGEIDAIIEYDADRFLDGPLPGGGFPTPPGRSADPYETPPTIPDVEREQRAQEEAAANDDGGGDWWKIALAIAALLAALVGAIVVIRRRRDDTDDLPPPAPEPPVFEQAISASIKQAESDPDPRAAILAAYGQLLDGFRSLGLERKAHEGPEEHLRRALAGSPIPPGAAHDLTDLFVLARFSEHPIGEPERQAAIAALGRALPAPAARTTRPTPTPPPPPPAPTAPASNR